MKNRIVISIALLAVLGSCSNDEKGKPAKPHVYPIHYNSHMVKTITGKGDRWSDFKGVVNYGRKNLLDTSYITNKDLDSIGYITVERSTGLSTNTYKVNELVVGISQDSIARLDILLTAKYGVGNYSLKDSIPKNVRKSKECINYYYTDGRTYKYEEKLYAPKPNMGGTTNKEFDNTYYLRKTITHLYEYNKDGYVIVDRTFEDEHYDLTDAKLFHRKTFKYEVSYDKDRIVSFEKYELIAGGNYQEIERYDYSYANGKVVSIKGNKSYNKTFEYSGDNLKINDNGTILNYRLTSFGYPSRIEDGKGGFMEIEYVQGHGEMDKLIPFTEKLYGNPYIR